MDIIISFGNANNLSNYILGQVCFINIYILNIQILKVCTNYSTVLSHSKFVLKVKNHYTCIIQIIFFVGHCNFIGSSTRKKKQTSYQFAPKELLYHQTTHCPLPHSLIMTWTNPCHRHSLSYNIIVLLDRGKYLLFASGKSKHLVSIQPITCLD